MKSKGKGVGLVLVVCCFFLVCFLCVGFCFSLFVFKAVQKSALGLQKDPMKALMPGELH